MCIRDRTNTTRASRKVPSVDRDLLPVDYWPVYLHVFTEEWFIDFSSLGNEPSARCSGFMSDSGALLFHVFVL